MSKFSLDLQKIDEIICLHCHYLHCRVTLCSSAVASSITSNFGMKLGTALHVLILRKVAPLPVLVSATATGLRYWWVWWSLEPASVDQTESAVECFLPNMAPLMLENIEADTEWKEWWEWWEWLESFLAESWPWAGGGTRNTGASSSLSVRAMSVSCLKGRAEMVYGSSLGTLSSHHLSLSISGGCLPTWLRIIINLNLLKCPHLINQKKSKLDVPVHHVASVKVIIIFTKRVYESLSHFQPSNIENELQWCKYWEPVILICISWLNELLTH